MPTPISDEPGIPDLISRLQFQRDMRVERLQRGLTRRMKDVENMPLIEPSENAKQKAGLHHSVLVTTHGRKILKFFSLGGSIDRKGSGTNSVLKLYTFPSMIAMPSNSPIIVMNCRAPQHSSF